jgi:nicotinate phosphoribosyltransferase
MAHSYVQSFPDELTAFRAYARSFPERCVLLVDTYDTLEGVRRAAVVGRELAAAGHTLAGVRLDSGDLAALSFDARRILDQAGLTNTTVFASGSLDEHVIAASLAHGAPIDGFGVGSRLGTSADAPYLDMAYKLVAYDGRPVLKLSAGKATWPGPKQIWRARRADGSLEDCLATADEAGPPGARPLLVPVMEHGQRLARESVRVARERAQGELASLPPAALDPRSPTAVPVRFSAQLQQLRDEVASRVGRGVAADGERD